MIEKWAFYGCTSLTTLSVPSSTTTIKKFAFFGCSSLVNITIPSLKVIKDFAFCSCTSLKQINLPSSLTSIGCSSFKYCTSLEEVTIPFSVQKVGSCCFEGCSSLQQITFLSPLNKISNYMFKGCSSLKGIEIPSSVTEIGLNSFDSCSSLIELTIPSSVSVIGQSAFSRCSSLTKIEIPLSISRIENWTFKDCSSLREIMIPASVTYLGFDVFNGCSSLKQVTIPSSVLKMGNEVFEWESDSTQKTILISETMNNIVKQKEPIKYFDIKKFIKKKKNSVGRYCIMEKETGQIYVEKNSYFDHSKYLYRPFQEFFFGMLAEHPTIIKSIGFSFHGLIDDESPCIIMELAQYSLPHFLIPNELTNTQRQIILIGSACALKILHDNDIVHRNISSSSILLDENLYPKLKNFSLSHFENDTFMSDNPVGTPLYLEKPIGEIVFSKISDVFAFSILMLEIVTCSKIKKFEMRKFTSPVKEPIKNLIESCWCDCIELRPTMNDIFEKLAYDSNYYLDDVDKEQIKKYINEIT